MMNLSLDRLIHGDGCKVYDSKRGNPIDLSGTLRRIRFV